MSIPWEESVVLPIRTLETARFEVFAIQKDYAKWSTLTNSDVCSVRRPGISIAISFRDTPRVAARCCRAKISSGPIVVRSRHQYNNKLGPFPSEKTHDIPDSASYGLASALESRIQCREHSLEQTAIPLRR